MSVGHVPGQQTDWTPVDKLLDGQDKRRPGTCACLIQTTAGQPCLFSRARAVTHSRGSASRGRTRARRAARALTAARPARDDGERICVIERHNCIISLQVLWVRLPCHETHAHTTGSRPTSDRSQPVGAALLRRGANDWAASRSFSGYLRSCPRSATEVCGGGGPPRPPNARRTAQSRCPRSAMACRFTGPRSATGCPKSS